MTIHVPYGYDASAFRNVFEQSFTYLSGVERNSHRFAASTALHDPLTDRRWSYSELWSDVGRLAAGLSAHGIRAGDVIVFQLFNCPEFVLLWLAAQYLGAVASPINFRLSPGETAYVLDDSRPRVFVHDAVLGQVANDALSRAQHEPGLVVAVDPSGGNATSPRAAGFQDCSRDARRRRFTAASMRRPPACTPPARPGCRREFRSTASSRFSRRTT